MSGRCKHKSTRSGEQIWRNTESANLNWTRTKTRTNLNENIFGWCKIAKNQGYSCITNLGFVFHFGSGPISWIGKKKIVVALSSIDVEYCATWGDVCEVIWLCCIMDRWIFLKKNHLFFITVQLGCFEACEESSFPWKKKSYWGWMWLNSKNVLNHHI